MPTLEEPDNYSFIRTSGELYKRDSKTPDGIGQMDVGVGLDILVGSRAILT